MKRTARIIPSAALVGLSLTGCDEARAPTDVVPDKVTASPMISAEVAGRYLVLFSAERVPAGFENAVANLGGAVEASLDRIGVAAVVGLTENTAASLATDPAILTVEPDPIENRLDDGLEEGDAPSELAANEAFVSADATASPSSAAFYPRQWNMRAVRADRAWAAGHFGSRDVVVAILDTGIDYLHPDLVGLVDLERSASFVPEDEPILEARYPGRLPFSDLFWHGTAAASIVASNAQVLAGINRNVTLLAVKIADRVSAGSVSRMIAGIMYAAEQGADVINVSRGHERDKSQNPGTVAAFERAATYAFSRGALIVSLPFNDSADLDHNADLVRFPCEAAQVICASATAPTGAAGMNGPWDNVDARATYSGFGRSAVDIAAPGGAGAGFPLLHTKVWLPCTSTPIETTGPVACRSTSVPLERRLGLGIGTSWAAPHVSGLAALLVAQLGHGKPAVIRARILQSADDLGEPGTDPYYGKGRINIARALGIGE